MKTKNSILNQLIAKGGIYGNAAKIYLKDEIKSRELIFECFLQCHVPNAKIKWGEKLISEIKIYCKSLDKNIKKPDFAWKPDKALPAKK